jgi:outer membrane receptor for ferrienterochelin and colicins
MTAIPSSENTPQLASGGPSASRWAWPIWLILCSPLAWAAPTDDEAELAQAYGDKSVVSIATGSAQPLRRAPSVATVITAEDIQAMGAADLDEVLETVPGLHVSRSTQTQSVVYVMRGIHNDLNPQVLMLVNGVPMTTLVVGNRGVVWAGMPLENVSRIEVIRGPGSAVYGADAFAGVINVITKSASDIKGSQVGLRLGSFDSTDAWWLHGGKWGAVDVAAYLRSGKTAGSRRVVEADAQTGYDGLFNTRASQAPGSLNRGWEGVDGSLDLSLERWRLRLGYVERTDVGSGSGAASALDPNGRSDSRRMTADLSYQAVNWADDWDLSLQWSYMNYRERSSLVLLPPGTFGGTFPEGMQGSPQKWEYHSRFNTALTYTGWSRHRVRFGAGYADENLYRTRETKNFFLGGGLPAYLGSVQDVSLTSPFLFPHRREVGHAYAQDEWNFAQDWTLTAGLRHDHYSDFGGTTNPRLALVWDVDYNLTAKLLYGRAFRAPAFGELYAINNPVALGNPDLKPERIETLEGAVLWQATPAVHLEAGLFEYRMRDILRLSGTQFANSGKQVGRGVEFELTWDAKRDLRLSGNFAHQQSTDKTTGQDAGNSPQNQLYGRADWRFRPGWLLNSQVNWVAGRKRVAGDTRPAIKDYTTFDLSLSTQKSKAAWDWSLTVKNVFNADAREPSPYGQPFVSLPNDLPLPRRTIYLMAAYRL